MCLEITAIVCLFFSFYGTKGLDKVKWVLIGAFSKRALITLLSSNGYVIVKLCGHE